MSHFGAGPIESQVASILALGMARREFIALLGGTVAAWPLIANAQQPERMQRIGVLLPYAESDRLAQSRVHVFVHRLQELGWAEGRNIRIEYGWAGNSPDDLRISAARLVAMKLEVILAVNPPSAVALKRETRSIPIVFVVVADAVGIRLVDNLAKPEGNLTGFTIFEFPIAGKWLELLKEIAPRTRQVAVIQNPTSPSTAGYLRSIDTAAASVGVRLINVPVQNAPEIERAIETIARESSIGLIVLPDPSTTAHYNLITELAAQHRLPAIYPYGYFAESGGLISYGPNVVEQYWQGASYVDRILKGEKPADLPVQLVTKYELAINLRTAKLLGLAVPQTLLAVADKVIE
jgi:putative ABC transport system substrate-binding protein